MRTLQATFKPRAISTALMLVCGPAWGQEPDLAALTKPDSTISLGVGNWSADRPQQGIYDGMRDKGTYGLVDTDIVKRDDATGTWLKFNSSNLGLDNREMRGEYNRQGEFGAYLEYGKTPRDNPYTINSRLQGIGTTNLTVGTNRGSFPLGEVHLGTEREMSRLGGYTNILPGLDFKVDFKNERKTGTRQTGWGSAVLFSVEPIDSTTRQLETILQYTSGKLQLSGGYLGSWYDNDNPLILQRLNGTAGGTTSFGAITPLSQPMSNEAHQLFLDGGYAFTPTTRGTFKLAYTRATQDEHLPTYDLTGANAPFVGAPSHLDGRVDTTLVQLGISSRPLPKLSITGNLRYYDVNDKTPTRGFVGNNTTRVASVFNTPQSFTTTSGKLEATYRMPMNFGLTGGVEHASQDRSYPTLGAIYVPFRADVRETTYKLQLRRSLADNLNGAIAYLHSKRDGSSYVLGSGTPYVNDINPMHIADRRRDKIRSSLDWDPSEQVSVQFRIDHAQDDYPSNGRPYGLQSGSAQIYAIDASYLISDKWKLASWYSYDLTKAKDLSLRTASGTAGNAVKTTHIKDTGESFGASLRGQVSARVEAGLGLDWFRNTSDYPQDIVGSGTALPAGLTAPAEIKNKLLRLRLDGKYAIDKASEVRFDLIHERWHADDSTWNFANGSPFAFTSGNGNATCASCTPAITNVIDGTTVTANSTQTSTFVGVRYIYHFQ